MSYAVWIYYRFNLSHRDIEDLLAERGITVSRESIRHWCIKFGALYTRKLRRKHKGYGDIFYIPEDMEQYSSEDLLKALGYVFSRQNIVNLAEISDHPQGDLDDGLPSYREQIGTVTLSTGDVPIYLQRVPDGKGGKVWKLSNATVAEIPAMWDELGYSPVAEYLSAHLPDIEFMGMDNWQLLATALAFVVAWPLAALASYILMRLALMIPNHFPMGIQRFFRGPMRFFLFILIASLQLVGAAQLRFVLAEVRKLFLSHPALQQDTVSVRFSDIADATAILRLDAGVETTDFQEFLAVAEDLNLHIVDIVQGAGAVFSGPGELVQLREVEAGSAEQLEQIEATLQEWREQDRLPFPDYSAGDMAALKGSLNYPPNGSPS